MKVILEKGDCYCNLDKFYENVARKMGINALIGFNTVFDCREICVTKAVKDELWGYYYKEEGLSNLELAAVWTCVGPKANLENEESEYVAKVSGGFISWT